MITAYDVREFLQKQAIAEPTVDVKPEPTATGSPGLLARAGTGLLNKVKANPINAAFTGYMLYGAGQQVGDAWKQWDVNKQTENELAQYAQQINTLDKEHPFLKMMKDPKTDFEKDMDEYGYANANFRHAEREEARAKANALDEKQRRGGGPPSGNDPKGKDLTMTGQFQRAYKTNTVPVTASRYQRG
jgi:hypothetical protein